MRRFILFTPLAAFAPMVALAHEGTSSHAHPHGSEWTLVAAALLAVVMVGVALWRARR